MSRFHLLAPSQNLRSLPIILVLAAIPAFCQSTCSTPSSTAVYLRSEGLNELLGDYQFSCTGSGGVATIQVSISPALPITSAVLSAPGSPILYTEALAITTAGQVQGVVNPSGTSIVFTGVTIPPTAFGSSTKVTIANIRVNVTGVSLSSGFPPVITEGAFLVGPTVNPVVLAPQPVAFVATGLGAQRVTDVTTAINPFGLPGGNTPPSIVACTTLTPAVPAFFVRFSEGFQSAFKIQGNAATNTAPGNPAGLNTESGIVLTTWPSTPGASNVATGGTRIKLVLSNVPQNVVAYFPTNPTTDAAGVGSLTLTSSETGALAPYGATVPDSTNLLPTGLGSPALALVASSGNTITVIYEVTAQSSTAIDSYSIPVYFAWLANTVSGSATPIGVSVSLAPSATTATGTPTAIPATIPAFATGKSTTPLTGPVITPCFTTLLFPFVTNESGFDTSIVISNTTSDPFGSAGAGGQSGTCSLYFYGLGAPSPSTNVPVPNTPSGGGFFYSGQVTAFVLSDVAPGFQGYLFAACKFQYAHGFASLSTNFGQPNGTDMGYLALVLPNRSLGATPESSLH